MSMLPPEAEVIRDAVRRLADAREAIDARKLEVLRAALAPGLADAAAGRFAPATSRG
jgi:hypothetical protein